MSTDASSESSPETPKAPMLRVISGNPTPEELAVIVALASARSSGEEAAPAPKPRGGWNDPERLVRQKQRPGPGAWRVSR